MTDSHPEHAERKTPSEQVVRLRGELTRIRYLNDDATFAVADLVPTDAQTAITLVGNLLSAQPGESLEIEGVWRIHPQFGRQCEIQSVRSVLPSTREGIQRYLASGLVEGIGGVLAQRIVDTFGTATLDILDDEPGRLEEVEGIGRVRAERICRAWKEQSAVRRVMVFLQSQGVSPHYAAKIYAFYGDESAELVQTRPYQLARDIPGIGFRSADRIAQQAGLERDGLERLSAGVIHTLKEARNQGHIYLPLHDLIHQAAELLDVLPDALSGPIHHLIEEGALVMEPAGEGLSPCIYHAKAYRQEKEAARHVRRLMKSSDPHPLGGLQPQHLESLWSELERQMGLELAPRQRDAVLKTWQQKISVITGGPGTGKTTIIRAICLLGDRFGRRVTLAAPTGRAAKRMSEATGRPAQTLHRLLSYSFKERGFQYHERRPLDVDLLIVDEASMVDNYLFSSIVRALPDQASLLLVGDVDQLPSVGPGAVLAEIMGCEAIEVTRLHQIFRQSEASSIVVNAHRINRGEMPVVPRRKPRQLVDFYTITASNAQHGQEQLVNLVTQRIPTAFGFDPIHEIQILSPMHRGTLGCQALNLRLQQLLHPHAEHLSRGNQQWRVGDKVIQTRNNYEREVFNGDIGQILAILHNQKSVTVRFDERMVSYDFSQLDELQLAYAITVHKSQGSEYPAVVVPVVTEHYILLQRNLLYTAVTRAKELVVLIGSPKAVHIAVSNDQAAIRHTRLAQAIQELE